LGVGGGCVGGRRTEEWERAREEATKVPTAPARAAHTTLDGLRAPRARAAARNMRCCVSKISTHPRTLDREMRAWASVFAVAGVVGMAAAATL
jgi:hypothetical protein